MFYRWAKRLDSMQLPATAFPAAPPDPVETEESHELDGALIASAIASLWVLVRCVGAGRFGSVDWILITFGPIFLVAICGALLVRAPAPLRSIAAHVAAYGALAVLMGLMWVALGQSNGANPALEIIGWGAFFALVGLVIAVLCVVAWSATLRELVTPGSVLRNHAGGLRVLCVIVILSAALMSAHKAIGLPFAQFR